MVSIFLTIAIPYTDGLAAAQPTTDDNATEAGAAEAAAEAADAEDAAAVEEEDSEDNVNQWPLLIEKHWYDMFSRGAYIVNMCLIGIPWALLGSIMVGWNLMLNMEVNEYWAGGNMWLLANTGYALIQYCLSLLLVFEIDDWIKYFKFIRFASLISGALYIAIWLAFLIELFNLVYDWTGVHDDLQKAFVAMTISYNLIIHMSIIPIILVITIKEGSMELFQFANDLAGTELDDTSLGFHNLVDMLQIFNPWWWFDGDNGTNKWMWE